jgi:glycosyltransferase involved in cell wall biosynthesis
MDQPGEAMDALGGRDGTPRVLMLTAYPSYGGPFPKLAPLLLEGLRGEGFEVGVLGWSGHSPGPEPLLRRIAARSFDLVRVLRCVTSWRPDVIYVATSHSWPTLIRDIPLAASLTGWGPPLVLHLHGSGYERLGVPGQRLFTALSLWLARRAAAVMLLSTEELEPWSRICPGVRFDVVVNPFVPPPVGDDVDELRRAPGRVPTLLIVARLMRAKGVFELVESVAALQHRRRCRLVVAGTGPAEQELREHVRELGVTESVNLRGYLSGSGLDRAYREADVFVLPSYHKEGFPLSVMEAMGYGLPIVTTRIRGCADSLVPEENARFVPARDPRALAEALDALLGDPDARLRMGRANRRKVREFAPEVVVPRYATILRAVMRTKGRS